MDEKQALLEAAGLLPAAAEIRAYLEGFDVSVNRGESRVEFVGVVCEWTARSD